MGPITPSESNDHAGPSASCRSNDLEKIFPFFGNAFNILRHYRQLFMKLIYIFFKVIQKS